MRKRIDKNGQNPSFKTAPIAEPATDLELHFIETGNEPLHVTEEMRKRWRQLHLRTQAAEAGVCMICYMEDAYSPDDQPYPAVVFVDMAIAG